MPGYIESRSQSLSGYIVSFPNLFRVRNCMVGNFHEGFIFVFFVSQEPFAKIKTAKILSSTCKRMNRVSIPDLLGTIYIAANRTVSVSVRLTAIAGAIQEIEMLRKHRCTNQTAAQGREQKQSFNTFLAALEQKA